MFTSTRIAHTKVVLVKPRVIALRYWNKRALRVLERLDGARDIRGGIGRPRADQTCAAARYDIILRHLVAALQTKHGAGNKSAHRMFIDITLMP